MTIIPHNPLVLLILDGYGYTENTKYNAIAHAKTPTFDKLWKDCPHELISGSGEGVGLPAAQMGNSEVGHLNLGAGRIVYQEFSRITKAIADRQFFSNEVLIKPIDQAVKNNKAVHIMGLLSSGGVHSHSDHLLAAIELAARRGAKKIYLHAILDGRDTPPKSASASIAQAESKFNELGVGAIATLIGRYYAMDRDKRWERIKCAYDLVTAGIAEYTATTALAGLQHAYERGETDEFVKPISIHAVGQVPVTIADEEVVLFMNFRADRARQITRSFIDSKFTGFTRQLWPQLAAYICLTQYDETFSAPVAYPPTRLPNIFAEYIARQGLRQLRIAETEKYAHVTFFFNGGVEIPFPGEDRELIASPSVATYDLQPEMSAQTVTDKLVMAIYNQQYDCIIVNYANADMVGHTGNYAAAVQAVEYLDHCLARVVEALDKVGGELIITADHGNADCMYDEKTKQPHTAHTVNPVPFIYKGRPARISKQEGILADISPTMLYLMGLTIPEEMTGTPLVELIEKS